MGKDGASLETQGFGAVIVRLHDHGANDVAGHQIRGELDAGVVQPQDAGECTKQCGLAETGDTLQQDVPPGKQADQDAVDDILLADDDFGDFCADSVEFSDRLGDISFTEHLFILRHESDTSGWIVAKG